MLGKAVFGAGLLAGTGALAKQRYDTYKAMYNGETTFLEATKQNAKGLFDFGVGFTPWQARVAVAGANVAAAESDDRSQTAVNESLSTVSPVNLLPAAQLIDSVPQFRDKLGKPIVQYAHDKGYTHVQSACQASRALAHEELRGNQAAMNLVKEIAMNHPSTNYD